jgi:hypothetical protein
VAARGEDMTINKFMVVENEFEKSCSTTFIEKSKPYIRHKPVKYLRKVGNKYIYDEPKGMKNADSFVRFKAQVEHYLKIMKEAAALSIYYYKVNEKMEENGTIQDSKTDVKKPKARDEKKYKQYKELAKKADTLGYSAAEKMYEVGDKIIELVSFKSFTEPPSQADEKAYISFQGKASKAVDGIIKQHGEATPIR